MPTGDVFFWYKYHFSNGGEPKSKFLLQINNPIEKQPFLFCICNSTKQKRFTHGCHEHLSIYSIDEGTCQFPLTTNIDLKPEEIQSNKMLKAKLQNQDFDYKFTLNEYLTNSIIRCLKRCDDISPHILSLLKN